MSGRRRHFLGDTNHAEKIPESRGTHRQTKKMTVSALAHRPVASGGVHFPSRKASLLPRSIVDVLSEPIDVRGTSVRDYRDARGRVATSS